MASVESQADTINGNGNAEKICVAIRMRPLNEREKSSDQEACFRVHSEQNSIVQLRGKCTLLIHMNDRCCISPPNVLAQPPSY